MAGEGEVRRCRLQHAVGVSEPCPEAGCAFWEADRGTVPGRCAFERVDLGPHPTLAAVLLGMRARLEALRPGRGTFGDRV